MNFLAGLRSPASKSTDALLNVVRKPLPEKVQDPVISGPENTPPPALIGADSLASDPTPADEAPTSEKPEPLSPSSKPNRRWSFKPALARLNPTHTEHKPVLSSAGEQQKRQHAAEALEVAVHAPKLSSSDRRAQESAFVVRALIFGDDGILPAPRTKAKPVVSKNRMSKAKAQLLEPKSANKVIAQLRTLSPTQKPGDLKASTPIHAVCLALPEADVEKKHFRRFQKSSPEPGAHAQAEDDAQVRERGFDVETVTGIATATVDSVSEALKDLGLVNLIATPDFGLGQPGDGEGLLAGAVPTAETVINGVVQITPQLMSLGYATGKAIMPDHTGVYPPTDRMSVLTYWWGLELVLPPPTIAYLDQAQSISHTVMNFLSALAMIYGGVREILPFVRYISKYMEFEFGYIKQQNKGKGVVCAATWLMPAAMVPRPWDFPTPPNSSVPPPVSPIPNLPVEPSPKEPTPPVAVPPFEPTLPAPGGEPEEGSPPEVPSPPKGDEGGLPVIPPIAIFPGPTTGASVAALTT